MALTTSDTGSGTGGSTATRAATVSPSPAPVSSPASSGRPALVPLVLGLAVLLLLYETVGRSFITGITLLAVLGLLITSEPTITSEFHKVMYGA